MKINKYIKKPIPVEAVRYTGDNYSEVHIFCKTAINEGDFLLIPTLEGDHKALPGDFIIKGVEGEFYPCKPNIFNKTYKKISS